jgi:Tol biopolymer transport system component
MTKIRHTYDNCTSIKRYDLRKTSNRIFVERRIVMNRTSIIAAFFALLFLAGHSALAQSGYELFQKGLVAERTEGNLEEAIYLYKQIVNQHKDDRALIAKALVQMGGCYEKLGQAEAQKAYQRVIEEFAEQQRQVAIAKERLAGLEQSNGKSEVTVRKIWGARGSAKDIRAENYYLYGVTRDDGDPSSISPDGRYIAYTNWGPPSIAVYDLTTGESRDITDEGTWDAPPTGDEFGYKPIWSPDGRYVAYTWSIGGSKEANLPSYYQLRISGLDGAKARVICSTDSWEDDIMAYDWSADGKTILATIEHVKPRSRIVYQRQITLISVEDGSQRILKRFDKNLGWSRYCRYFFSPDGRYIAFNLEQPENLHKRDIYLLKADETGDAVPLVKHPADDDVLGWTPDGKRLLFATDRTGVKTMATIEVHGGEAWGVPQPAGQLEGGFQPMGLTRNGTYYYSINRNTHSVYTAAVDMETGKVTRPPELVNVPIEAEAGIPCWSPDGKYLAFISRARAVDGGEVSVTIQSVNGREVRELEPSDPIKGFGARALEWSPDGKSFLVFAFPNEPFTKGRPGGLFKMDAQTGDASLVTHSEDPNEIIHLPAWSADGKSVSYELVRRVGWNPILGVRIMERDLETGAEREIVQDANFGSLEVPRSIADYAFSPDGGKIVFVSRDARTKNGTRYNYLKVKPVGGGETTELFRLERSIGIQGWTPDGRYILFQDGERFGGGRSKNLWAMPATGGEPRKIELSMKEVGRLRVHPDGRQIAFASTEMKLELWAMEKFLPDAASPQTPAATDDSRSPFGLGVEVSYPDEEALTEFAARVKLSGDDEDWNAPQWCDKVNPGKHGSLDGLWESRWITEVPGEGSRRQIARVKTVGDWVYIMCGEDADELIKARRKGNRLEGGWIGAVAPGSTSRPWVGLIVNDERIDGAWTDGSFSGRRDFRRNILPAVELRSPESETYVAVGTPVHLQADTIAARDTAVRRVEFLIDGKSIGDDTEAPYQFDWERTKQGSHWAAAKVYDSAGATELSLPVNIMVGGLKRFVTRSEDDAEEVVTNGSVLLDTRYLNLLGGDNVVVGLRFTDIRIPRGAKVKHAHLHLRIPTDRRYRSSEKADLVLQAELTANSTPLTKEQHNITSRSRTKASVKWSPEPWAEGEWPRTEYTPDLARLVQEVVNQPDWQEGRALVLIISGNGQRHVESWDQDKSAAPMLYIDY